MWLEIREVNAGFVIVHHFSETYFGEKWPNTKTISFKSKSEVLHYVNDALPVMPPWVVTPAEKEALCQD